MGAARCFRNARDAQKRRGALAEVIDGKSAEGAREQKKAFRHSEFTDRGYHSAEKHCADSPGTGTEDPLAPQNTSGWYTHGVGSGARKRTLIEQELSLHATGGGSGTYYCRLTAGAQERVYGLRSPAHANGNQNGADLPFVRHVKVRENGANFGS